MLFVDSSIWIDYLNGQATPHTEYLDDRLDDETILVGDLVLTEVLQGYRDDNAFRLARDALLRFDVIPVAGSTLALKASANYRHLRARGITIRKTIDVLIATRCIEEDWPLLYTDRDFDPFVAHLGLRSALRSH